jgi:hypothetical protein
VSAADALMATDPDFASQKSEIAFFMEKTFQISFTYFGGLIAFFALSKTSFMKAIVQTSGIRLGILVALVVMLLNLVYLTLACACLYAILKSGMFILKHSPRSAESKASLYVEWEKFVRDDSMLPAWARLRPLAWNIDNYYMLPLFSVIILSSAGAGWYALAGEQLKGEIAAAILIALYVIPGYMSYYMAVLNRECRRLLTDRDPAKAAEPHLNEQAAPDASVGSASDLGAAEAGETAGAAAEGGVG